MATIGIDGGTLGEHWGAFADQMAQLSFAIMDPALVLGLIGDATERPSSGLRPSPASTRPG